MRLQKIIIKLLPFTDACSPATYCCIRDTEDKMAACALTNPLFGETLQQTNIIVSYKLQYKSAMKDYLKMQPTLTIGVFHKLDR